MNKGLIFKGINRKIKHKKKIIMNTDTTDTIALLRLVRSETKSMAWLKNSNEKHPPNILQKWISLRDVIDYL